MASRGPAPAATIDYGTCKQAELPTGWSSERGGHLACAYTSCFLSKSFMPREREKREALRAVQAHYRSVRLIGSTELRVRLKNDVLKLDRFVHKAPSTDEVVEVLESDTELTCPWHKTTGEPALGGMQGNVSISAIVKKLDPEQPKEEMEQDAAWLELADQLMRPGGKWGAPFALVLGSKLDAKLDQTKVGKRVTENYLTLRVHLYATRLLFYLIADPVLSDFIGRVAPHGLVRSTASLPRGVGPPMFTEPQALSEAHTTVGILQRCVDTGYEAAPQPPELALEMKPYQRQTLQWMMDQEALELGLNGVFWQKRSWTSSPHEVILVQDEDEEAEEEDLLPDAWRKSAKSRKRAAAASAAPTRGKKRAKSAKKDAAIESEPNDALPNEQHYYYSPVLGELRLEPPPLVRGGLLCEEMGMGKTLEIVALLMSSRSNPRQVDRLSRIPKVPPRHEGCIVESAATLVVVPDALVSQWVSEIRKSVRPEHALRVATCLPSTPESVQGLALDNDVVITTFANVQKDARLQTVFWARVVIDEMQEIRSSTTQVARMCEGLSAHARWMVSGTPLFAGYNDLNGLLNFLSVWPFSLKDSVDGFWHERIEKPLNLQQDDPAALGLLHVLLQNVMMRHVKSQRFLDSMESILSLPASEQQLVGLPFEDSSEESAYRHLELLAQRAHLVSAIPEHWYAARERPSRVLFELLRQLCVSGNLIGGGGGVRGQDGMLRLTEMYRELIRREGGMTTLSHSYRGLPAKPFMSDVSEVHANVALDYFVSRRTQVSHADAVGSDSHLQTTRDRLEDQRGLIDKLQANIYFMKHGVGEDGLPRRRWKWAIRAVTSGAYFLVAAVLTKRDARCVRETPLLGQRGVRLARLLREYVLATTELDAARERLMREDAADPVRLFELMGVREYRRGTKAMEEYEGEVDKEVPVLMFSPSAVVEALDLGRVTREAESKEASSEEDCFASRALQGQWLVSSSGAAPKFPLAPPRHKSKTGAEEDLGVWFDYYEHEEFWKKALVEAALHRSFYEKRERQRLRHLEYRFGALSNGADDEIALSNEHCWALYRTPNLTGVRFEALFYWDAQNGDRAQAYFPVKSLAREGELTCEFLDGTRRAIRSPGELRAVFYDEEQEKEDERLESVLSPAEWHEHQKSLALRFALRGVGDDKWVDAETPRLLRALAEVPKGRESNAEALELFRGPSEEKMSTAKLAQRRKRFDAKHHEVRLRWIYARLARDSPEILREMSGAEANHLESWLAQHLKSALSVETEEFKDWIWPRVQARIEREDALDQRVRLLIGLGLLGPPSQRGVFASKFDRSEVELQWCERRAVVGMKCRARLGARPKDEKGQRYDELSHCEVEATVVEVPSVAAYRASPESHRLVAVRCGEPPLVFRVPHESIQLIGRLPTTSTTTAGESTELFQFWKTRVTRTRFPPASATWSEVCLGHKRKMTDVKRDAAEAYQRLPEIEQYVAKLESAISSQRDKLMGHQGYQALEKLAHATSFEDGEELKDLPCAICIEGLKAPVVTKCLHLYCFECLQLCHHSHVAVVGPGVPFQCPLCRQTLRSEDVTKLLPSQPSKSAGAALEEEEEEEETAALRGEEPVWSACVTAQRVQSKHSELPSGVLVWDPIDEFTAKRGKSGGWTLAVLPKMPRTFLRVAAGLAYLGADAATVPTRWSTKVGRLVRDVGEIEGKVVVFSQFATGIAHLYTALKLHGIGAVRIARGVPHAEMDQAVRDFASRPEVRVMCLHAGAAAAGLNLTEAQNVFFLEPFLNAGLEAQAKNRVYRIGQHKRVLSRIYYVKGTIEERVLAWRGVAGSRGGGAPQERVPGGEEEEEGALGVLATNEFEHRGQTDLGDGFLKFVLGLSSEKPGRG